MPRPSATTVVVIFKLFKLFSFLNLKLHHFKFIFV
jgi:hypothetical protein